MARTIVRASQRTPTPTRVDPNKCDWPICPVTYGLVPYQNLATGTKHQHCPQHHEAILTIRRG